MHGPMNITFKKYIKVVSCCLHTTKTRRWPRAVGHLLVYLQFSQKFRPVTLVLFSFATAFPIETFALCNMIDTSRQYCATSRKSRVRFPMMSLEFFIDITVPAALWPSG